MLQNWSPMTSNMMIKKRKLPPNSSPSSSKPIPRNIIIAIFSKLPVKSLVRFKSLAKFCSDIITDPSFAAIHKPIHIPKPGLLITCSTKLQSSQMFFVADQNGGAVAICLKVPPRFSRYTTQSTNGVVCMDFGIRATVCNPSTGQAVTLNDIVPVNSPVAACTSFCVNFIGFDPKNKQYKVLNSWGKYKESDTVYRVYTINGPKEWRKIEYKGPSYYAQRECLCINGIIFFRGWLSLGSYEGIAVLICFNVETEKIRAINLPRGAPSHVETSCLIRLAGRLAIVDYQFKTDDYCFWVLEDFGREIWTQHSINFPKILKQTSSGQNYVVAGSIDTGEIMMVPQCLCTPFFVYYYDLVRAKFRRVKVTGLPEYDSFDLSSNSVFVTNYVENIQPLP